MSDVYGIGSPGRSAREAPASPGMALTAAAAVAAAAPIAATIAAVAVEGAGAGAVSATDNRPAGSAAAAAAAGEGAAAPGGHGGSGQAGTSVWMEVGLLVGGMQCAACASSIEKALLRMEGVAGAVVSVMSEQARVTFDSQLLQVRRGADGQGNGQGTGKWGELPSQFVSE